MVSIIELRFLRLIERYCPDDQWKDFVSESRIDTAQSLLSERQRRGHNVRLLDCLQLSDKAQIVIRNESIRQFMRFESKRQAERMIKRLESLRNHLAHAQDLVETDWETIVLLSENLERVISGPPGHGNLLEQ